MPLTILNVAYPLAPVSPDAVGGCEQVVAQLDAALVRAGHHSLVLACEGSRVAGKLYTIPRVTGTLTSHLDAGAHRQYRALIAQVLETTRVDVIHFHGIDFHEYMPDNGPPALVTLHLPPSWYAAGALQVRRPQTYFHAVSAAQERACPPGLRLEPVISNGVPVERLAGNFRPRNFALCLGRVCPEKGFHLALDAARDAGCGLLVAGEVYSYTSHQEYYQREIAPRLDRTRRFIGPVNFARKRRLLGSAKALLVPSLAAETSSLVAMEALACGTPVIAFHAGALPEIIEDGVTGFLVDDVAGLASALARVGELDRGACVNAARRRFSVEHTNELYIETYRRIAARADAGRATSGKSKQGGAASPAVATL